MQFMGGDDNDDVCRLAIGIVGGGEGSQFMGGRDDSWAPAMAHRLAIVAVRRFDRRSVGGYGGSCGECW